MSNKINLSFFFVSIFIFNLSAQKKNPYANKLYDNLGYKVSINQFEKKDDLSVEQMAKIANSHRLNHETVEAEMWYERVVQGSKEPIHYLHYAQALQSNKKYDIAKKYFAKYNSIADNSTASNGQKYKTVLVTDVSDIEIMDVTIKNEKSLNSDKLDFSPSYFKDGIVFISNREAYKNANKNAFKDIWTNDNFMSIFYAPISNEDNFKDVEVFALDLTTRYHEGPVSFNEAGDKIFFTRNDYLKGKKNTSEDGVLKLEVYTASKVGDTWSKPKSLSFNQHEYDETHPSISRDGNTLYFASNRPGGMGGMDIYKSELKGGVWGEPVNLGPEVNTSENEMFPYIHADNTLYFASNGLPGLGGLDIFSTKSTNNSKWMKAKNIGAPFNSSKDDFGYICNDDMTEGYLTSARDGGLGKDDIYSFEREAPLSEMMICVFEEDTGERITNATVEMSEKNGNSAMSSSSFVTDENGVTIVKYKPNVEYNIVASKDGYEFAEDELARFISSNNDDTCIPMKAISCANLFGMVKNDMTGEIIPNASVIMLNSCTGEEMVFTTNSDGKFDTSCIDKNCVYNIVHKKSGYQQVKKLRKVDLSDWENKTTLNVDLVLSPMVADDKSIVSTTISSPSSTTYTSNSPDVSKDYDRRSGIEIKNIFYDFNKSYIRSDASEELDKIVTLMQENPSISIELGSHTDSRGKSSYNQSLSQKRADKAVNYLVSKGINRSRLIAKGYGEQQIKNQCANFVVCTEEEHQYNRRTEIKIIGKQPANFDIIYIDNRPVIISKADANRKFTWD
jgi:outer membrane protein OmpA-like peptidoglycan-associated protein